VMSFRLRKLMGSTIFLMGNMITNHYFLTLF